MNSISIKFENMVKQNKIKKISKHSDLKEEIFSDETQFFQLAQDINIDPEILNHYLSWIILDNEYYYFKNYNCFEEIFMEKIFNKINIPTVKHTIVKYDDRIGIISPNFRKPHNQGYQYKYYDEIVKEKNFGLSKSIEYLSSIMTKQDLIEYKEKIYKLLAADIIFGQEDHYSYNINFEIKDQHIKLAPIFDNGLLFSETSSYYLNFDSCIEHLEFRNAETYPDEHTIQVLTENPQLTRELSYSFDYNLEEILKEIEKEHNIKILTTLKKQIQNYYDARCAMIEKTLNLLR